MQEFVHPQHLELNWQARKECWAADLTPRVSPLIMMYDLQTFPSFWTLGHFGNTALVASEKFQLCVGPCRQSETCENRALGLPFSRDTAYLGVETPKVAVFKLVSLKQPERLHSRKHKPVWGLSRSVALFGMAL